MRLLDKLVYDNKIPKMPIREQESNKGTFGKVLNISGSKNYIGSAYLSTLGILKIGAGYTALCSTKDVIQAVSVLLPETVFLERKNLLSEIDKYNVILLGCGLGTQQNSINLFKQTVKQLCKTDKPLVLDADGLNILSKYNLNSVTVCEPHCDIKEFNGWKEFSYIFNLKQKVFNEIKFDETKDIVVFTDHGGLKRYSGFAKNNIYFSKQRDINTGLICKHSLVGELNTKGKALIVDDIVSTGDTIVSVIEMLKSKGIKEIYILSGHFENNKYNRRLFDFKEVKKVFSTNSLKKRQVCNLKLFGRSFNFIGQVITCSP